MGKCGGGGSSLPVAMAQMGTVRVGLWLLLSQNRGILAKSCLLGMRNQGQLLCMPWQLPGPCRHGRAWQSPLWSSICPMPAPCQHMETRTMQRWVVGGQLNLNPPGSPAQAG